MRSFALAVLAAVSANAVTMRGSWMDDVSTGNPDIESYHVAGINDHDGIRENINENMDNEDLSEINLNAIEEEDGDVATPTLAGEEKYDADGKDEVEDEVVRLDIGAPLQI